MAQKTIRTFFIALTVALLLAPPLLWAQDGDAEPPADAPAARDGDQESADDGGAQLSLRELLDKGGPIMYPLYLCSVVLLAFVIERLIRLRRGLVMPAGFRRPVEEMLRAGRLDPAALAELCEKHPSPIARIFDSALGHLHRPLSELEKIIEDAGQREARLLARPSRAFSIIADISPLIGLLGTVWGMIQAFMKVSRENAIGKPAELAEGIYQALVTTATGLTIAIPALVCYFVFTGRVERLVAEIDDLTIRFVDTLAAKPADDAEPVGKESEPDENE